MSAHFKPTACNGDTNTTESENNLIRHNWNRIGYNYWFSDYSVEYWRHPETSHVVNIIL